jgi:hypothetical protein
MTQRVKLLRRASRLRAPVMASLVLAFGACDSGTPVPPTSPQDEDPTIGAVTGTDEFTLADALGATDPSDPTGGLPIFDDEDAALDEEEEGSVDLVLAAGPTAGTALDAESRTTRFRGGIPFGTFHLPRNLYGTYNGSISNIAPRYLISYLEAARRSGTRVMLSFAGSARNFQNRDRSFSLEKWTTRVNRFRGINLSSYIRDGTIIGHYLMDEPHDPRNWGGRLVSRQTIEAMARYSKSRWPTLPTIVRSPPSYLRGYRYRYLDAAWAQYHQRFGSPATWIERNVRDARAARLALVTGVNQLAGGARLGGLRGFHQGDFAMGAIQLRSWGGAILRNSYPCAFLSWKFDPRYMARVDIRSAMTSLASQARARPTRTCRSGR